MKNNLLHEIFADLKEFYCKEVFLREDSFEIFFQVGNYIRNKYLWGNDKNINYFFKHYGVRHPDDISVLIVKDFMYFIKS